MQLTNQPTETDPEISPSSSRAASIDSLFEAPGPLLAGIVFVAIAAAITALKTEQTLTWACVALVIMVGVHSGVRFAAVPGAQIDPDCR